MLESPLLRTCFNSTPLLDKFSDGKLYTGNYSESDIAYKQYFLEGGAILPIVKFIKPHAMVMKRDCSAASLAIKTLVLLARLQRFILTVDS